MTTVNKTAETLTDGIKNMMAGSANDCDGACMETANTLSEMLFVASIGLVMSFAGFMTLYSKILK